MNIQIDLNKLNIKEEVNGGFGPQPKPEENRQLATDYAGMPENGLRMADLVAKFGSSPKNLYDRLKRMGVPRHKQVIKKKRAKVKPGKPFFDGAKEVVQK